MIEHAEIPPRLPEIHPGAFVAAGAVVMGDVRLGEGSSIWFQSVVRGDSDRIEIGRRSNVQDLTIVHVDIGCPTIVGDAVTIGHHAVIHGCVIEDRCLIGMGAILLSGSRIGAGSLVAAGSLVRERQVIPPGSLVVGAPARIAGEVQPAHREAITRGADHYEHLARSYAAAGLCAPGVGEDRSAARVVAGPGVPGEIEWEQWAAILEETPRWARARLDAAGEPRWIARPSSGGPSAHEIALARIDADRGRDATALERALGAPMSAAAAAKGTRPADTLDAWVAWRAGLASRLRRIDPERWCAGTPGDLARPASSAEVRWAAERDLAARRAMLVAIVEVGAS